jgi:hypothetical protein
MSWEAKQTRYFDFLRSFKEASRGTVKDHFGNSNGDIRWCEKHKQFAEVDQTRDPDAYDPKCLNCIPGESWVSLLLGNEGSKVADFRERRRHWRTVYEELQQKTEAVREKQAKATVAQVNALGAKERAAWLAYAVEAWDVATQVRAFGAQLRERAKKGVANSDVIMPPEEKKDDLEEEAMRRYKDAQDEMVDHVSDCVQRGVVITIFCFIDSDIAEMWPIRDALRYKECGFCHEKSTNKARRDEDAEIRRQKSLPHWSVGGGKFNTKAYDDTL